MNPGRRPENLHPVRDPKASYRVLPSEWWAAGPSERLQAVLQRPNRSGAMEEARAQGRATAARALRVLRPGAEGWSAPGLGSLPPYRRVPWLALHQLQRRPRHVRGQRRGLAQAHHVSGAQPRRNRLIFLYFLYDRTRSGPPGTRRSRRGPLRISYPVRGRSPFALRAKHCARCARRQALSLCTQF